MPTHRARRLLGEGVKASDISDDAFLFVVDYIDTLHGRWTLVSDLEKEFGQFPRKVILAKAGALIRRDVISGCNCGCYGGFELTGFRHHFRYKSNG